MRFVYALHDLADKRTMGAKSILLSDADSWSQKGYGIFVTVNSFHTNTRSESNIKKLNSWFVDLDGGNKNCQAKKIIDFELIPSLVVETKNGHHVYWNMLDQQTIQEYKTTLLRLIKHFDSDPAAKDAARILRVPGFNHMKDPHDPFMIKIIYKSDRKYSPEEINSCLPEMEAPKIIGQKTTEILGTDDFWNNAAGLDCINALQVLSGTQEVNGEVFGFHPRTSGGYHIRIDGFQRNCFVDGDGRIGPIAGPTIIQWLEYYGHNKSTIADIIKKYFPETFPKLNFTLNFK